jgi:hypothetical protein
MRNPSKTTERRLLTMGLLVVLAACSDEPTGDVKAAAPEAQVKATAVAPAQPPPPPALPPEAQAVETALADVQAFNAAAEGELAKIAAAEDRLRRQAGRALELAGRAGAASEPERRRLSGQVAAARAEAERVRAEMASGLAAFQAASTERSAQLNGALEQCAGLPTLAGLEACATLTAEQAALAQNIAALADRYQAAETAWRQERAKLDEASATMALGR